MTTCTFSFMEQLQNAMRDTLLKLELVRKVWIEGHVHWEWIGE